ncbi:MAG: hypothetical protein JSS42_00640 [Proteobacteria bacterium]|nr:hypothetical protein [Pseudomonadota bacterium]
MSESASHLDAPPLLERLVEALVYPRQSGSLSTLAAIAATHVVADWLPSLPGMVIDFIAWTTFLKYALEVLRWSANGRDTAPEFGFLVSESAGWFGIGVLIVCQILVVVAGSRYGTGAALAVGAAIAFAVPAIMMLIAIEDSNWLALNPLSWLRIAARLGAVYFVPVAFFALVVAAQTLLAAALGAVLARFIAVFALHFAVGWLLLANFRLIGVLIHDHGDEFDYAGDPGLRRETPTADNADKVIASARTRAASGDAAGAAALLLDELRTNPQSIGLHVEYRRWLREGCAKPATPQPWPRTAADSSRCCSISARMRAPSTSRANRNRAIPASRSTSRPTSRVSPPQRRMRGKLKSRSPCSAASTNAFPAIPTSCAITCSRRNCSPSA